jgi:hypothetical protein
MNQGNQRIACPKCRANNFLGQPNCWQCGSSLPPPEALGQPVQPAPQPYAPVPQAAPFAHTIAPAARKGGAWKTVVPVVLILVVAGAGLIYAAARNQKAPQAAVTKDLIQQLDQLKAQSGQQAPSSGTSANGPVDPDVAAAQRAIDKFRRDNPGFAPPTDAQGNVHLQGGGTITREQWERARNAVSSPPGQ